MTVSIADLLAEVSAVNTAITKTASKKSNAHPLSSVLDKIAEELSASDKKEEEKEEKEEGKEDEKSESSEDEDKEKKEEEMNFNPAIVDKIAAAVVKRLEKIAVDGGPGTQPAVDIQAGNPSDGVVGQDKAKAAVTDPKLNTGDQTAAGLNSRAQSLYGGDTDTIANVPQNAAGMAQPLQDGSGKSEGKMTMASVRYTQQEAEVLQKLASVGYEYLVDYYSDQIVNEKIAQAYNAEVAKQAPEKIAKAMIAQQQKTASAPTTREKLAELNQRDPELVKALAVLANRKLI